MPNEYARGVWYASPYIWQGDMWAVYSPAGVCVSIHPNKKEAVEEALRQASKPKHNCSRCKDLPQCACVCEPDKNSGRGRNVQGHQKDTWELTHGAVGYRLAKGFSFWR